MVENNQSTPENYSTTYAKLHWAIAACVISLFSMQYIRRLFGEDAHVFVRETHKSIGIVLIALVAWRLFLRLRTAMPPRFADSSAARTTIAAWVHKGLWVLMIAVPLLGVSFLLARGRGINFFGLFPIGPLTTGSAELGGLMLLIHRYAAFCLIALVVLHIVGALFHRFVLHDELISRMSSGRKHPVNAIDWKSE
jgi:cytochrome b561